MNITVEIKKQEALRRMKQLKLHENCINEFEKDGVINKSENGGILYWLEDNEKEIVKEFEKEYDSTVYHVIYNDTEFGELLTLFYVSDYEEEWEMDRDDLNEGYACAYVKNVTYDELSEFGSICFRPRYGGLVRTA